MARTRSTPRVVESPVSPDDTVAWTSDQLIRIDVTQALEPDFVADQTRSLDEVKDESAEKEKKLQDDSTSTALEKRLETAWMAMRLADPAASISNLLSKVSAESQTEHLTAGLRHTVSADEGQDVLARLARQLAALGLSADQAYQTLAYKRTIIVQRLYDAYVKIHALSANSSTRYRKLAKSGLHALLVLGIRSGVHVTLALLQSSATQNQVLCWSLLGFLKQQLADIPTLSFSLNSAALPHPELTSDVLDSVQKTLFQLCQPNVLQEGNKQLNSASTELSTLVASSLTGPSGSNQAIPEEIRHGALDLMLSLAVARGCLPDLLTIVKLLFLRGEGRSKGLKEGEKDLQVNMYSSLLKLAELEKAVVLDLPSQARLIQAVSVHELRYQTISRVKAAPAAHALPGSFGFGGPVPVPVQKQLWPIVASDGRYLYVYAQTGLYKIGVGAPADTKLGQPANLAGTIYKHVKGFKSGEAGVMVCVGQNLFWRGSTTPVHTLIVIDCATLNEVGTLNLNGTGTIPSLDNTQAFLQSFTSEDDAATDGSTADPPSVGPTRAPSFGRQASSVPGVLRGGSLEARPGSLVRTGSVSRSGSVIVPSGGVTLMGSSDPCESGFGLLTSDGQLLYSLTPKPEIVGAADPSVSVATSEASANNTNSDEKDEKEDGEEEEKTASSSPSATEAKEDSSSDSSSDEDEPSTSSAARNRPQPGLGQVQDKDARAATVLHAFSPADRFALSHSITLKRGARKGLILEFPSDETIEELSQEGLGPDGTTANDDDDDEPKPEEPASTFTAYPSGLRQRHETARTPTERRARRQAISSSYNNNIFASNSFGGNNTKEKKKPIPTLYLQPSKTLAFDDQSITIEMWIRLDPRFRDWGRPAYRQVFHKGSGNRSTFLYISDQQIMAGTKTTTGMSLVRAPLTFVDLSEWFHLAVSFDVSKKAWTLFLNGNSVSTIDRVLPGLENSIERVMQNMPDVQQVDNEIESLIRDGTGGNNRNGAFGSFARAQESNEPPPPPGPCSGPIPGKIPWIFGNEGMNQHGGVQLKRFIGQIRDLRMWSSARTEEEIKSTMPIGKLTDADAKADPTLAGYWRLDDGLGLTVHDASRWAGTAFIRHCKWTDDDEVPNHVNAKANGADDASSTGTGLEKLLASVSGITDEQSALKALSEVSSGSSLSSSSMSTSLSKKKDLVSYPFHLASLEEVAMYTNGECLALLYRPNAAAQAFPIFNLTDQGSSVHVVQIFDVATGEMQDERLWKLPLSPAEIKAAKPPPQPVDPNQNRNNGNAVFHSSSGFGGPQPVWNSFTQTFDYPGSSNRRGVDEFGRPIKDGPAGPKNKLPFLLSTCLSPDGESMWLATSGDVDGFKQYTIRPPIVASPWRAKTLRSPLTEDPLAPRRLQRKYPLKKEISKRSDTESEKKPADESVSLHIAITQILLALNQQLEELGAPNSVRVPPSLILPIAVDLSEATFQRLLDLTEYLVNDYYRSEDELQSLYGEFVELRLFGLLVAIRLLKTNIAHLVTWNVDPAVAFSPSSSDIQSRFSVVLNRLIFQQPGSKSSKIISTILIEDVTSCLSKGMTVFYKVNDRIEVMRGLMDTALGLGEGKKVVSSPSVSSDSPADINLQLLLMNRYLQKLTQPDQVISLLPAFIESASSTKGDGLLSNDPTITGTTHPFLAKVYQLVHRSAEEQLQGYFNRFGKSESVVKSPVSATSADTNNEVSTSAINFLKRVTISMVAQSASKNSGGQNSNSQSIVAYEAAIAFVMLLLKGAVELLSFAHARIESLLGDVRFDPISGKEAVLAILADGPMVLLQPLLSSLMLLNMNAAVASQLLPVFLQLLSLLNEIQTGVPAAQKAESEFIAGDAISVPTKVKRKVESPSRVQGMVETMLTIPGATSMSLTINQLTQQSLRTQGASLILYREPNQEGEIDRWGNSGGFGFGKGTDQEIHVKGDTVHIVFHAGENENHPYGFCVEAVGNVLEVQVKLPFLLDLAKNVALVAGRLGLVLVRGIYAPPNAVIPAGSPVAGASASPVSAGAKIVPSTASPAPSSTPAPAVTAESIASALAATAQVEKWVVSEFLSEGVEFDSVREQQEEAQLSWLPKDESAESSKLDQAEFDQPLTLKRAGSYRLIDVSLPELTRQLDEKLHKSDAKLPPFPIASQVVDLVTKSIRQVFAVLLKMNMQVTETQTYLLDSGNIPSENLVRTWKAAYRMRGLILQRFQEKRNAIKSTVKPEDEDKQKIAIYTQICSTIISHCDFLLTVVPVPMRIQQKLEAGEIPQTTPALSRQASSSGGAATEANASLSSKIVAAWNQSKSNIGLRDANPEERFNLVWKHTLNFISTDIELSALEEALRRKRDAARMRAAGYRMICRLLNVCKFSCIKRELISSIMPALGATPTSAYDGARGALLQNCKPSNLPLERQTRAAFRALYESLLQILKTPQSTGTALLCSILHTFSLNYEQTDLDVVVSLGIFPLLNTLLLTFSKPNVPANETGKKTDDEDEKEEKADSLETIDESGTTTSDKQSAGKALQQAAKAQAAMRATYHAAFTLLDLFMSTLLTSSWNNSTQRSHMSAIHGIVEVQLANIASNLLLQVSQEDKAHPAYLPNVYTFNGFLPQSGRGRGGFGSARPSEPFRFVHTETEDDESTPFSNATGAKGDEDVTSTDVLAVVDKLAFLAGGRARIAEFTGGQSGGANVMLTSLIQILKLGSARSRVVVLRILRRLCTSAQAPSFATLNACFQATAINDLDRSLTMVDYLLRHIGACLSAPAIAAVSTDVQLVERPSVSELLHQLRLYQVHSPDSVVVWAEEMMLLRCLVSTNPSGASGSGASAAQNMSQEIVSQVKAQIAAFPKIVQQLVQLREERLDAKTEDGCLAVDEKMLQNRELIEGFFRVLGALATIGGWVDGLRVGNRVRILAEGGSGTIVSHKTSSSNVEVLRDEEGSIVSLPLEQVVVLADVSFNPKDFQSLAAMDVLNACCQVLQSTSLAVVPQTGGPTGGHTRDMSFAVVDQMLSEVRTRTVTVLFAYLTSTELLTQVIQSNKGLLDQLFALGLNSNSTTDYASVNDYKQIHTRMELLRRTALPAVLFGKLTKLDARKRDASGKVAPIMKDSVAIKVTPSDRKKKVPDQLFSDMYELVLSTKNVTPAPVLNNMSFQPTCFGMKDPVPSTLSTPTSGRMVYLPLNAPVPQPGSLNEQIVLIDSHESHAPLKPRILALIKAGAKAVILCLHSMTVAEEGLTPPHVLEAIAKLEKSGKRAAENAQRAARQAADVTAVAAARGRAMRGETIPQPTMDGPSGFGNFPAFGPGVDEEKSTKEKEKEKPVIPQQTIDDLSEADKAIITSIPVVAVSNTNATFLRTLCHVQDRAHPERLHRAALFKILAEKGYTNKSHASKALRKSNWDLTKAAAWLDANKEWLQNQPSLGGDDGDSGGEDGMGEEEPSRFGFVFGGRPRRRSVDDDEKEEEEKTQPDAGVAGTDAQPHRVTFADELAQSRPAGLFGPPNPAGHGAALFGGAPSLPGFNSDPNFNGDAPVGLSSVFDGARLPDTAGLFHGGTTTISNGPSTSTSTFQGFGSNDGFFGAPRTSIFGGDAPRPAGGFAAAFDNAATSAGFGKTAGGDQGGFGGFSSTPSTSGMSDAERTKAFGATSGGFGARAPGGRNEEKEAPSASSGSAPSVQLSPAEAAEKALREQEQEKIANHGKSPEEIEQANQMKAQAEKQMQFAKSLQSGTDEQPQQGGFGGSSTRGGAFGSTDGFGGTGSSVGFGSGGGFGTSAVSGGFGGNAPGGSFGVVSELSGPSGAPTSGLFGATQPSSLGPASEFGRSFPPAVSGGFGAAAFVSGGEAQPIGFGPPSIGGGGFGNAPPRGGMFGMVGPTDGPAHSGGMFGEMSSRPPGVSGPGFGPGGFGGGAPRPRGPPGPAGPPRPRPTTSGPRNLQTAWANFDPTPNPNGSFAMPTETSTSEAGQELTVGVGAASVQENHRFKSNVTSAQAGIRGIQFKSTSALLADMLNSQQKQLIHYIRKTILNLLLQWPKNVSLRSFASPSLLSATVHVAQALDAASTVSAEINPEQALVGTDYRVTLLKALRADAERNKQVNAEDKPYLSSVILQDVVEVLASSTDTKGKGTLTITSSPLATSQSGVLGLSPLSTNIVPTSRNAPTTTKSNVIFEWRAEVTGAKDSERQMVKLEVPDCKALLVHIDSAVLGMDREDENYTIHCVFYDEDRVERRRCVLRSKIDTCNKAKLLLPGSTAYYSVFSTQRLPTGAPLTLSMKLTHVKRSLSGLTIFGNLHTTLLEMDVLLYDPGSLTPSDIHKLTMLLLQTLCFITDKSSAQMCCAMAAKLFRQWRKIREELTKVQHVEILTEIQKLESSYLALRLQRLTAQWNVQAPSVHLQILLELVLSARTAVAGLDPELVANIRALAALANGPSQPTEGVVKPTPYLLDAYAKYREGGDQVRLIHLQKAELVEDNGSIKHVNTQQSHMFGAFGQSNNRRLDQSDTYIAPVCVKGSRQWYYEVTIKEFTPDSSVLACGWVTRDIKYQERQALQQEPLVAWTLAAPGQYIHKPKPFQDVSPPPSATATYSVGTVIGVWLDLETRTMCWSFNGKIDKPAAFSNVPDTGLYPAIGLGACEVSVNFGAHPFKFHPNDMASKVANAPADKKTSTSGGENAIANLLAGHSPSETLYLPLECPGAPAASYLDSLDNSYNVLQNLAERREPLPPSTVREAIECEVSDLQKEQQLQFEYSDCDLTSGQYGSFAGMKPTNTGALLQDNATTCTFQKAKNVHITFQLTDNGSSSTDGTPESAQAFILKSVQIRTPAQQQQFYSSYPGQKETNGSVYGLIFLSQEKPVDYEQFEWSNDMTLVKYRRFVQRKMEAAHNKGAAGESSGVLGLSPLSPSSASSGSQAPQVAFLPHEPVGFISNTGNTTTVTFTCDPSMIRPARFVTLKLTCCHHNQFNMNLEYIKFSGMLTTHPLSVVHGVRETQVKVEELRQQLLHGAKERTLGVQEEKSDVGASFSPIGVTWTLSMDENLVAVLSSLAQRAGVSPSSLDCIGSFHPTAIDLSRYMNLQNVPLQAMRSRVSILKYFNKLVAPLLGYVGTSSNEPSKKGFKGLVAAAEKGASSASAIKASPPQSVDEIEEFDSSLSSTVRHLKGVYFLQTKKAVFESFLAQATPRSPNDDGFGRRNSPFSNSTPGNYSAPRIQVNRARASRMRDDGTSASGQGSLFHQIFAQLKTVPAANFRNLNPDQQVWNVTFQGEGSIDVGGPFRESVTCLCADLMSSNTSLFITCPNGVNGVGLNRSTYVPSPQAASSVQLQQFEFIGVLFGIALRTRIPLALDLPSSLWKSLLDQPLDVSDLEAIDKLCVQALTEIKNLGKNEFASMFVDQKFTTQLSDHTEQELKPRGREINVTWENREEFIRLSYDARLKESEKQIASIKKGLNAVVPTNLLALFSWYDLELLICGSPVIDIDVLRRHTVFNKLNASDDCVIWLFKCLHSFNSEERQLFLRFVWGRNRLPATDTDWNTNFTINKLSGGGFSDETLPVSHTCFVREQMTDAYFSIDLPAYSSYEILRKKVLYAIINCQAIDVDFNPQANDTMTWVD